MLDGYGSTYDILHNIYISGMGGFFAFYLFAVGFALEASYLQGQFR